MKNNCVTSGLWQVVTANDYKSIAVAGPGKPMDARILAEIEMEDQECFHSDLNDEPKANARLMAAAPRMLAALREIEAGLGSLCLGKGAQGAAKVAAALAEARAAISGV